MQHHLLSNISYLLSIICGRGDRSGRSRDRSVFTLIEMLVVIVIIVILMGVVFRMTKGIMGTNDTADTKVRVQAFKTLIEEFHDEYGCYPPVPESNGVQPVNFSGPCPDGTEDLNHYLRNNGDVFQFGLASFFVNRAQYGMQVFNLIGEAGDPRVVKKWKEFNDLSGGKPTTTSREKAFLKRTKPLRKMLGLIDRAFLEEYDKGNDGEDAGVICMQPVYDKEDPRYTIGFSVDVGNYVYISKPPYTSYIFFSPGLDGQYDASAPDDPTLPKNRDNIYGTLGDK